MSYPGRRAAYLSDAGLCDFMTEDSFAVGEGIEIEIEKVGGGTVGRSYAGTWRYVVSHEHVHGFGVVLKGQDVVTRIPVTHRQAAALVADWLVWGEDRPDDIRRFGDRHEDVLSAFTLDSLGAA